MFRQALCLALLFSSLLSSGCLCFRPTYWYANAIDDVSDFKAKLDPLYEPGLDISRVGMPDWNRFGLNRFLCPCENGRCHNGRCSRCKPVYYPAEYRIKYWAYLEQEARENDSAVAAPPQPEELQPFPEEAPLPMPVPPMP